MSLRSLVVQPYLREQVRLEGRAPSRYFTSPHQPEDPDHQPQRPRRGALDLGDAQRRLREFHGHMPTSRESLELPAELLSASERGAWQTSLNTLQQAFGENSGERLQLTQCLGRLPRGTKGPRLASLALLE